MLRAEVDAGADEVVRRGRGRRVGRDEDVLDGRHALARGKRPNRSAIAQASRAGPEAKNAGELTQC